MLYMCVLPYIYRKILKMLPKLMELRVENGVQGYAWRPTSRPSSTPYTHMFGPSCSCSCATRLYVTPILYTIYTYVWPVLLVFMRNTFVRRLFPPICPTSMFLPHFRLYGVASLHVCVLPCKYREISEMALKLMKLCELTGCRAWCCLG